MTVIVPRLARQVAPGDVLRISSRDLWLSHLGHHKSNLTVRLSCALDLLNVGQFHQWSFFLFFNNALSLLSFGLLTNDLLKQRQIPSGSDCQWFATERTNFFYQLAIALLTNSMTTCSEEWKLLNFFVGF